MPSMLHSGLVSVTFRKLSPREVVDLVAQAGLEGVEWGGDVHVPHGDTVLAREVRRMTEDAGLSVASYGSYYRVGHEEPVPFRSVLKTAVALGAPTVRVWAGKLGSADADAAYRDQVVQECRRIADLAAAEGLVVATEFHGATLTDTCDSARRLMEEIAHANLRTYWQIPTGASQAEGLECLCPMLPWLENVHAFWWASGQRLPLSDGTGAWQSYLREIRGTGRDHWVMIEFVKGDAPEAFLADAMALKSWLPRATGE